MTVVQSDTAEVLGGDLGVFLHVGPQVGAVFGPVAIAQLHAVAPADELATHVHVGACEQQHGSRLRLLSPVPATGSTASPGSAKLRSGSSPITQPL